MRLKVWNINPMQRALGMSLTVLVVGVVGVAGCYGQRYGTKAVAKEPATGATGQPLVVVIPGGQTPEFWRAARSGAEAAGKEFKVDVAWQEPHEAARVDEQIKSVYATVEKHPAGIVLAPMHRVRLLSAVNKSSKSRVPIVLLDQNVDTNFRLSLIGADHEQAGLLAARRIGHITGGTGKVGVLVSPISPQWPADRADSFARALSREFPKLQIVRPEYSDVAQSRAVVKTLFHQHPDLGALFTTDEDATLAALAVMREVKLRRTLRLVGADAAGALRASLEKGEVDALLVQNPHKMGYEGVKAIVEYRNHRRPPKRIDSGLALLTRENMDAPEHRSLLAQQ